MLEACNVTWSLPGGTFSVLAPDDITAQILAGLLGQSGEVLTLRVDRVTGFQATLGEPLDISDYVLEPPHYGPTLPL